MKKNNIYIFIIVLFVLAIIGIVYRYNKKQSDKEKTGYDLLPRKGAAGKSDEWKEVQKRYNDLASLIKTNPSDVKSLIRLGALYIEEARVTGNYVYYDKAAMHTVNNVLAIEPDNFYGLVFKSLIYLSQHHFSDGLNIAYKAKVVNPANSYVYGLLVDGNVEMGQYDSAVKYADQMVSIRPDLTSYSRVSYLREIYGDYPGSIKAMRMAVETGGAGDEHTEWTRTQLAQLFEKTGDSKSADSLYNFSLALRPSYPYALAGLGRLALANKDYNSAISYYLKADSIVNDNSLKEGLADVYRLSGNIKKAMDIDHQVIEDLNQDAQAGNTDENIGHYADKELAYAYLKVNDNDKALEHAMLEYNRRPDNIDVNETVAWVLYKKGEFAKAVPYMKVALKTHSKNPVLLNRAALIFNKAGDSQLATATLLEANASKAFVDPQLKSEVETSFSHTN